LRINILGLSHLEICRLNILLIKHEDVIDDILVLYQQDIEPAYLKMRETKYIYSQVETSENADGALVQMYNDNEFYLSQKKYSYHELFMPVIMPMWIADNRIVSKPVGPVVAPQSYGTTVHQPDPSSTWYKGKAAELAAAKAKMFEGL
jgi:hypothetical protein